jgi:hypothetical protein
MTPDELVDLVEGNIITLMFTHELTDEYVTIGRKRHKLIGNKEDWWKTPWGLMLLDPDVRDISTRQGKEFRRRFRLPAPFFLDWLVPECLKANIFDAKVTKDGDLMGHIPIEIKILVALRILARGNVSDDISEMSKVGLSTCPNIFSQFVLKFATTFRDSFIYMPEEGDDLTRVMNIYARLGFPGCLGSMDVTHVHWLACPLRLKNLCIGKEGYPTLAFQVLVDHSRMIRHVSTSCFGAMNDINICHIDTIVRDDIHGLLTADGLARNCYKEIEFVVYDEHGQATTIKGAYVITDGGYEPLAIFVNPNVNRCDRAAVIWAEFIESVRKDVECTFGVLKSRFHFLKTGCRYSNQKVSYYVNYHV